ncbi:MAG: PDZ domain-containing protein [Candidatus Aminicenantes bacterium]|nr:PDZ domain-containing protein [Candidatus Aminicenantes bacterium]
MKKLLAMAVMILCLVVFIRAQVNARMMQNPDVSKTHIVFSYGGDLWIVPKDGGTALKLSSPEGQELYAKFSPDGSEIAFNGIYGGNFDVYVMPALGGIPKRVTHHGMTDRLIDWYPDGKNLLFVSSMNSGKQRFNQFYKVGQTGGLPEKLPIPYGEMASLSPDGKKIAYTPISQAFRTWKRYRGGWHADIWIFDLEKKTAENISRSATNDEFPMWSGNKIYYLSDRGPEMRANVWSHNLATKENRQITKFTDFDIHFPSLGPADIVFEKGGELYLLSLADEKYHPVQVKLVTDEVTLMPKVAKVSILVQGGSLSPDGKRAVIEARGEIFSVPAVDGPIYNLTKSSGVAERYPAWSPDGRFVAYWSDRSGEYELTIRDMEKPGEEKKMTSYGPGYRYQLFWSPNSKMIAFIDKAMEIFIYDLDKNTTVKVDKAYYFYQGSLQSFQVSWSSDSRWMAYSRDLQTRHTAAFLYDVKANKAHQVTSGFYADANPTFDPDGKYLYFETNRTFNPVYGDVDNTFIYANSTNIAAVPLTEDVASPVAPKNDVAAVKKDEPKKDEPAAKKDEKKSEKEPAKEETKDKEKPKEVKITLENFEKRLVVLPPAPGNYGDMAAVSGKLIYHKLPNTGAANKNRAVVYYDFENREEKTIIDDSDVFMVSADGKKILIGKVGNFAVVDIAPGQKMEKLMPTAQLEMTVDPRAEWRQIFNEVWRLERDFFYDPNMHGVDWKGLGDRYGKLIDNCVTRWDVNFVIGELIAELSASHTYRGGGDTDEGPTRNVGCLGIDWEIADGAYRIAKIIAGAPWDSEVRSPLQMSGLKVKEGDYILAVNGTPLNIQEDPWSAFEGLAGKTVELTVNSKPSLEGAQKVIVKTMADETRLRNLAWIESNRKRVEEATKGRVGYIYVPSTGIDGQNELVRQFAAQYEKAGLIIDERFNDGGQIPDRFIELLDRKPLAFWAVRDGLNWQWPPFANFGPKVMLINGWSGSGGDAFPDYFRKAKLGPLVGTRTWGGLIGLSGSPGLIDGGTVTVPTFRMYDPDGKWFKEGHGVEPDIEVIDDPSQLAKGVDPQLERAILEAMKALEKNPPVKPKQPPYEKR